MLLKLVSNYSKKEYTFTVEDENLSRLNYAFDITLPEGILDGEYTYKLYSDNTVISTGLAQVGDYERPVETTTTYNNNEDNIIVYNG